jgi:hypothetical protein
MYWAIGICIYEFGFVLHVLIWPEFDPALRGDAAVLWTVCLLWPLVDFVVAWRLLTRGVLRLVLGGKR